LIDPSPVCAFEIAGQLTAVNAAVAGAQLDGAAHALDGPIDPSPLPRRTLDARRQR